MAAWPGCAGDNGRRRQSARLGRPDLHAFVGAQSDVSARRRPRPPHSASGVADRMIRFRFMERRRGGRSLGRRSPDAPARASWPAGGCFGAHGCAARGSRRTRGSRRAGARGTPAGAGARVPGRRGCRGPGQRPREAARSRNRRNPPAPFRACAAAPNPSAQRPAARRRAPGSRRAAGSLLSLTLRHSSVPCGAPGITAEVCPAGSARAATGMASMLFHCGSSKSGAPIAVASAATRKTAAWPVIERPTQPLVSMQARTSPPEHRLHRAPTDAPEGEQAAPRGERSGRSDALRPARGPGCLRARGEEGDPAVAQLARAPDKVRPVVLAGISGDFGAVVVDREKAQMPPGRGRRHGPPRSRRGPVRRAGRWRRRRCPARTSSRMGAWPGSSRRAPPAQGRILAAPPWGRAR